MDTLTTMYSTIGTPLIGSDARRDDDAPAPRQEVRYECPGIPAKGLPAHAFGVTMSAETTKIPHMTRCPQHGEPSKTRQSTFVPARTHEDAKLAKPPKTQWEMLMERRTEKELEAAFVAQQAVPRVDWVGVTTWLRESQTRRGATGASTELARRATRARWAAAS